MQITQEILCRIGKLLFTCLMLGIVSNALSQEPWVVYPGGEGPGKGKHIVFVTGEESYRSEESMPLMARILSRHHGFKCTVLFAVDPKDGTINVLGETWVSHYGKNLVESTRCNVADGVAGHPILRGVSRSFWLPDDVYGISATLHGDCMPLLMGQPLVGWKPEDKPQPDKQPIPIAWTKTHTGAAGKAARVFTTTMGHGDVFQVADFRRLLANACYWCLGMEAQIDASSKVDLVGTYNPGPVGAKGLKRGVKPSELMLQ